MDEIRSWWEVPSIAHFCSLFRTAFDLTDFDIEDLEDALLETETEEGSAFILDLICRLLNGCYARKDITVANYDLYVKDIVKYKWSSSDNPVKEKSEFKELTLREKVEFIYAVCEYRLDTEDVSEVIKGFDGDSMRVEPLGKDKDGALYWYFYGSRLYMEDAEPKKTVTKEEKKALEREKRLETKKKKQEEKRQRKEEKKKLRTLKKNDKKKELEKAALQKVEEANTRRSGRLRNKKIILEESDSSESSSSSEEEEEDDIEESSSDNEEEEEIVERTPVRGRGRSKKTPAKSTGKKTNKKTPAKKETPKPTRASARKTKTTKKMEESKASQPGRSARRSLNSRNKVEPLPTPSAYDSETEEENDMDVDSGHESAGSVRSETSKMSQRISEAGRRTSRRPTANAELTRDLSNANCEKEDDEDSKGSNFKTDDVSERNENDVTNNDNGDEAVGEKESCDQSVDDQKMEVDVKDNSNSIEDQGLNEENSNNSNSMNQKGEEEEMNHDAIKKTNETEASVAEKDDNVVNDHVESNIEESKENINKEDLGEVNDTKKMDVSLKNDVGESETNHEVTPDKDVIEKSLETDQKSAENVADVHEDDDNVKVENNVIDDKDSADDTEASENTKPDIKTENEPMDFEETSHYSTRGLRNRVKGEPVNVQTNDEKDEKNEKEELIVPEKPAVAPTPSKSVTRWHLVCETLDDWVNLAEWFKESTVRCEKALSKEIRENFLPVLPEIIEAREKEITRKLLQEQELRRSNRITLRMREKMEQEKILAEALAEEEKARIQAEEEKRLKEEQLRLEDENRQREDRRKAREDRTQRLCMREERARLLAEGKEIPPELIYTGGQKYKDDDDSDDSRCDLKDQEDFAALMKVINAMKYHKDCWPFLQPVTDEQAPDYSDIIKRPMDLSKIEEKVERREYRSRQHFLSDFRLMFNNCKRYNGQDSEFSDCARSMEQMLKKYMKRFITEEPTDKYYEDEDFMVAGGKGRIRVGEKRFRPKRAASSKAIETVYKALNSSEEESSSDEDDRIPVVKKRRDTNSNQSPFKVQSHHDLLLQELKRQREKKLAASALHNHQVITRGPERIRVPNPAGGVMIIPKSEMNSSGVLRMAATRELKRKVNTQFAQKGQVVHTINPTKKDLGLNIIDQTSPGSSQPKTIRIVASSGTGQGSVKQTAENVKVSADGFLIISGKNSGIKVTENTKIVIQPPGQQPQGATSSQPPTTPTAQSPVTITTGNTPDFSQLAGAGKVLTPKPNPGSSGQKTALASSDTSNSPSVPGTGHHISLTNLLKQASGSQILSANEQARLQALIKQMVSEGSMTPEKAKTVDIARRILQLNLQKRKMLQQKSQTTDVNSPKVESQTNDGSESSSLIEQKLRDPNVNIDSQLGSVSKNVISNVNIASDILDTYYSVMNESKTSIDSTAASKPSAVVAQAEIKTTVSGVTSASPACQSTVSPATGPVTSNIVTSPLSSKPPTPQGGSISDVTRLIINLMNKGDAGGGTVPDNQRPSASSTNNVLTQSVANSLTGLSQNSVTASSVGECPERSNIIANTFSPSNSSSLSGLTSTASVSELLKIANMKQNDPPKNTVVDPIEALLTANTTIKSNSVSVSKTSIMEALASNLSGPDMSLNTNQSHIPQVVSSLPLPEKNERPNLFDSFDTDGPSSVLITSVPSVNQSVSVTDAIRTAGASSGNQTASANALNSSSDKKSIRMKLKADKMPRPSSSTINFGSPLKTTSVLEALKCKLHTLKPDVQGNESSDAVCTCMKLSLCSDVSDACRYDPRTACSQSPVYCRTAHLLHCNSIISSTNSVQSPCSNIDGSMNDLHNEQLKLFDAFGNFVSCSCVDSNSIMTTSVVRLASKLPSDLTMKDLKNMKSSTSDDENVEENHLSSEVLEMDSSDDFDINNDFNHDVNETDSSIKACTGKDESTIQNIIKDKSNDYINVKQGGVKIFGACSDNSEKVYLLSSYIHDNSSDMWVLDDNNNVSQEGALRQSVPVSHTGNKNTGNVHSYQRPRSVSCQTSLTEKQGNCLNLNNGDISDEDEEITYCECSEEEPTMSSLYHENGRTSRKYEIHQERKYQINDCTQCDGNSEKTKINDVRDDQTDEDEHLDAPSNCMRKDEEKKLNSPRYTYKMRARHVSGSVLKVSVDVKEFHYQKNEQNQCEEASPSHDIRKYKDYVVTRPQLKHKNLENTINFPPYSSSFSNNYLLFNSPQIPALTSSCTYLNSPHVLGQRNNFSYVNTAQLPGLSDGHALTSPLLLNEARGWTFPTRSHQSPTHTRPGKKKNRFQLSENMKTYKVCSIKSRMESSPKLDVPPFQQHDLCVVNTRGLYSKKRGAKKRLNLSGTPKRSWCALDLNESSHQLSSKRYLPGSVPISTSKPVQQCDEQSIFEDSGNSSLISSLSSNYDPFISSTFNIRSESPSQASIDSSLLPGVDINSPELLSNPFFSNPFSGDGNDFDHDLAKIENDIFELQEKYPTTLPSKSNARTPSSNLGNKSPEVTQQLVNRTSALNTSGFSELGNSDLVPRPIVSTIQELVSNPVTIQTSPSQQQRMNSSNIATIPIPVFQNPAIMQSDLSGMQAQSFPMENESPATVMLGTGLSNSTVTSIPTIKVIPQPTSLTVDFSELDGRLNLVGGSTIQSVSFSNASNIGINVPIQSQLNYDSNQDSIVLGSPTNTNNMPVMTGSALKSLSASVSVTQSEAMDNSLVLSGTCMMTAHSENQSM